MFLGALVAERLPGMLVVGRHAEPVRHSMMVGIRRFVSGGSSSSIRTSRWPKYNTGLDAPRRWRLERRSTNQVIHRHKAPSAGADQTRYIPNAAIPSQQTSSCGRSPSSTDNRCRAFSAPKTAGRLCRSNVHRPYTTSCGQSLSEPLQSANPLPRVLPANAVTFHGRAVGSADDTSAGAGETKHGRSETHTTSRSRKVKASFVSLTA